MMSVAMNKRTIEIVFRAKINSCFIFNLHIKSMLLLPHFLNFSWFSGIFMNVNVA